MEITAQSGSVLECTQQAGEIVGNPNIDQVVKITGVICAGVPRDLARYIALLPFGDAPKERPPHEAPMQVTLGHLGLFIATLNELRGMRELQQIQADATTIISSQAGFSFASRQRGYDAFDNAVGRLPIWQRLDEAKLWSQLLPHLAHEQR